MKKSIKILSALLSLVVTAAVISGCVFNKIEEGTYNFVAPDGAPLIAVADIWGEDASFAPAKVTYELTAESNLLPKFQKGDDAFIIAPINVGANVHKSFQAGGLSVDYKLLNVTSWGVLYFVTTDGSLKARSDCGSLNEFLAQFNGTSMATIGLAAIPGKTLDYVLKSRGVNCTLNGSEATTIQQKMGTEISTALFAEPAITALKSKNANVRTLASLGDVYKEISGQDFPMAGCFVRTDVIESNKALVEKMDESIKNSVKSFADNPREAGAKVEAAGSTLKAQVIESAASRMNVTYKSAAESMDAVKALLSNIGQPADDSLFVRF